MIVGLPWWRLLALMVVGAVMRVFLLR